MLRRLISLVAVLAIGIGAATSATAESDNSELSPYQLMKQVSSSTFERMNAERDKIDADPDYLKTVVEEEVMPHIHHRYAGLKLLGPQLKQQSKSDVQAFLEAFRAYMVTSYAQVLMQYDDQQLLFGPEQPIAKGERVVTVPVELVQPGQPNITISFKWRSDKQGKNWQAFDLIAEGISLLSSKQSEWSGQIRTQGLNSVTRDLSNMATAPLTKSSAPSSE